jgi:hypothetical protein
MSNTKLLCENIVYGQPFLNGKKQLLDNRLGFDKKAEFLCQCLEIYGMIDLLHISVVMFTIFYEK